ncbi:MAG: hypothetical protein WCR70_04855 [Sphaerochaetaceae bacterium]
MNYRIKRIFFAPEGSGEGGSGGGVTDLADKLNKVEPSYLKDLDDASKADDFAGIEDVKKLYDSHKTLKAKVTDLETQLKDSLKIPGADATSEQVKAFFAKIGMPDKAEGYELSDFDLKDDELAPTIKKTFLEEAFKSGLTKTQAKKLWTHEAATYSAIKKGLSDQSEKLKGNFDQRFDASLKDEIPDSTKRAERITKDKNLFTEFNGKYNMGAYFEQTGLSINPAFVHAVASMYEKIGSSEPGTGGPGGKHESEIEQLKKTYPSMFKQG